MRLAWISPVFPPNSSGQARVIGTLTEYSESIHSIFFSPAKAEKMGCQRLQPHISLPSPPKFCGGRPFLLGGAIARGREYVYSRRCAEIVRRWLSEQPVDAVIGCTASPVLLPAAWLAACSLNLPFIAYLFDDPVFQWDTVNLRLFVRMWERRWAPKAAAVIVPNEVLAAQIGNRNSVRCRILRNPIHRDLPISPAPPPRGKDKELRITYMGAIYHAHYDAFISLLAALERLDRPARLHVYTPDDLGRLRRKGVTGKVEFHDPVPPSDVFQIQRASDILFLPLGLKTDIAEIIKSSSPGKMGEYLASGTPTLVHAPPDSFLVRFFREKECGFVVDRSSPELIAAAIMDICNSAETRERVIANAQITAREFFPSQVSKVFREIVSDCLP